MPVPKGYRQDTDALEPEEYQALRAELHPEHWRQLFDLLWHTGIRVSEALALRSHDLVDAADPGGPAVIVKRLKRRKTSAPRDPVALPEGLAIELALVTEPGDFLFGKNGRPYTAGAAWKALRAAGDRAGVRVGAGGRSELHPHLYRHGFGRRFAQLDLRGAGRERVTPGDHLALLAKALGHAGGIKNAEIYFRPTPREVDRAMRTAQREEWTDPPKRRRRKKREG